ncbi:acyl-CoA dehydrogenase [Citromicrobium sp. RCC1885]|uniref:acyl-CoA dehydrogenase family protein n=1 Tax=unclassified Citromicrobium TaxID=2630544 RepID=UPI0006C92BA6|nr:MULTISPECIES: acyl-CoA dehydrogenase family protein [unclassified Citromicrobium]KPM21761.1 acyl-CoA dehydrogenase [Citromicrobium sp. RCC1885]KPM23608.1 acyl-CoA dehydrogenase [Citromicrobium sp. RCC1878]OAM06819.1 acyl-CoA dehydrogenase [Citromicrobium sp. RCC1897]|tara:strand:- start:6068 stop:7231 length:1164 start_codon:yes stop_codon:yes gene_type:complete
MPALDVPQPAFMDEEEIAVFADAVGKFYEKHAPESRVLKWRDDGQVDREFWREAGEAGLLGASVPEEYGGHGGDFRHEMVVIDQQGRHNVEGFAASLHNTIILPYLVRHGTEEQKKKYLPRLVSGDLVSAIAMTEPGVGSDLQSITTTALKDGNGYKINGAKTYISNGQIADFIIVVAKTDPNERAKGISLMLLETEGAEGFQRGKKLDKIGLDSQDTSELFFDDVFVPAENVLGGEEGKGFYQLMGELPQERLIIAMGAMSTIERALEETLAFTKERKAFGKTIWDFQNTQFTLAELKARATAAKVFVNHCIAQHLEGKLDVPTACMAKLWLTELQGEVVDKCLQLHGGSGYINDYPIARMFRDSRVSRIFGGSNEIMKMVIARGM